MEVSCRFYEGFVKVRLKKKTKCKKKYHKVRRFHEGLLAKQKTHEEGLGPSAKWKNTWRCDERLT